jgi:8-oxo-dGTP pyrophosphatase MutT (NUDIX family)
VVPVVAAVVRRADTYLVGRRPAQKRHGGLWEFPGGKLLDGESLADASRRELAEELGLEVVTTGAVLHEERDPGSPFLISFLEVGAAGDPTLSEHSEVGWFTAEELCEMPLAPSDAAFVRRCLL